MVMRWLPVTRTVAVGALTVVGAVSVVACSSTHSTSSAPASPDGGTSAATSASPSAVPTVQSLVDDPASFPPDSTLVPISQLSPGTCLAALALAPSEDEGGIPLPTPITQPMSDTSAFDDAGVSSSGGSQLPQALPTALAEFGDNLDTAVGIGSVVDCDEPHAYEVVSSVAAFSGSSSSLPDMAALRLKANARCQADVAAYVGQEVVGPPYAAQMLTPTAASWKQGDRQVTCLVGSADGSALVGTAAHK